MRKAVESPAVLSNGAWHVATCTRTATGLTLTIDGKSSRRRRAAPATSPTRVRSRSAASSNCDQIKTTCDYFTGDIDYDQDLELGRRGVEAAAAYDAGVDTDVLVPLKRLDAAKTRLAPRSRRPSGGG